MGYISMMSRIEETLAHGIALAAKKCAKKPKITVFLYFVIAVGLTCCLLTATVETDGEDLWVDQNSLPMQNRDYVNQFYDPPSRESTFFITAKNEGSNILTLSAIDEIMDIHNEVLAVSTTSGMNFSQLCELEPNGSCTMYGPLGFWNFDAATFSAQETSDASVQQTCAATSYPSGASVVRLIGFGQFSLVDDAFANAAALRVAYALEPYSEDGTNDEQIEWEDLFLNIGFQERTHVNVYAYAAKSIDEELGKSVGNDIPLMGLAYIMMVVFASLTLGRPCGRIHGRALLATVDILVILFAAGAAYGIAAVCGVPFTSLTQVLPFILVGIGIDNAYVIVASFDRTDPTAEYPERMYEALREAGMSITVTSLTDFFAFILASVTKLPAVQWFGTYAALSVLFIYMAHILVFPALLTLDTQRVDSHRRDILPCLHVSGGAHVVETQEAAEVKSKQRSESNAMRTGSDSHLEASFGLLASLLLRPVVKVIVIITFIGMGGIGVWQATQIENSFDLRLITPDDSYLNEFYAVSETYFGSVTGFSPVGLFVKEVDFRQASVHADLRNISTQVLHSGIIDEAKGFTDWHLLFTAWAQVHPEWNASLSSEGFVVGDNFAPALHEFLLDENYMLLRDSIVWADDNTSIQVSSIWFYEMASDDSQVNVRSLNTAEELTQNSNLGDNAFLFSINFLTYDQYRIIKGETMSSLSFALLAVVAVTTVLLIHPLMVLICVITVALVFACILGSLPLFWKISLNAVSCINLLMAISLVVDFSIHIMVTFGHQDPTLSRDERVRHTLRAIGPSVFLAISTTFLGILPLVGANSEVFRIFFKCFVSIVLFGGLYGLIFLPVVLSLVGPSIIRSEREPRPNESSEVIQNPPVRETGELKNETSLTLAQG